MSRIGKNPVTIPDGVDVKIEARNLTAKGKLGELSMAFDDTVEVKVENKEVVVRPANDSKRSRQMWGTIRSLVDNIVTGVSTGFTVNLEIVGVGYRAAVAGQTLTLQLGYSLDVIYAIPDGVTVVCERPTAMTISGTDKQRVGQVAAEIRAFRKPEPYKGKGIRYANEFILRKEGKKK